MWAGILKLRHRRNRINCIFLHLLIWRCRKVLWDVLSHKGTFYVPFQGKVSHIDRRWRVLRVESWSFFRKICKILPSLAISMLKHLLILDDLIQKACSTCCKCAFIRFAFFNQGSHSSSLPLPALTLMALGWLCRSEVQLILIFVLGRWLCILDRIMRHVFTTRVFRRREKIRSIAEATTTYQRFIHTESLQRIDIAIASTSFFLLMDVRTLIHNGHRISCSSNRVQILIYRMADLSRYRVFYRIYLQVSDSGFGIETIVMFIDWDCRILGSSGSIRNSILLVQVLHRSAELSVNGYRRTYGWQVSLLHQRIQVNLLLEVKIAVCNYALYPFHICFVKLCL